MRDADETPHHAAPGVEILFAGAHRDADSLIERLIDEDSAPGRLLVVSSDRRVQRAAKRRRAGALSAEGFLRRLGADLAGVGVHSLADLNRPERAGVSASGAPAHPLREQVPLDEFSTAAWMNYFGYDARDLVANAGAASAARRPPEPALEEQPDRDRSGQERPTRGRDRKPAVVPLRAPGAPPAQRAAAHASHGASVSDPLLAEAIREWAGRLSLDDLDMERWLGGLIERPRD